MWRRGLVSMTSARFPRETPPQVYAEVDTGPRGIDVDEIQAHLPEEPNSFIGRERELGELSQLLTRTRALTLCGPGGTGKTRLALRLLSGGSGAGSGGREGLPGAGLVRRAGLPAAAGSGGLPHRGRHRDHRGGGAAAARDARRGA